MKLLNEKSHRGQTHLKMTTRARAIQLKHQQQPLLCKVGYRRLYPTFASGLLLDFLKSGSTALIGTKGIKCWQHTVIFLQADTLASVDSLRASQDDYTEDQIYPDSR